MRAMKTLANNGLCPVCGSRVRLAEITSDPEEGPGPGWDSWQLVCEECGASGPYLDMFRGDARAYAIDGWNKLIGAGK